MNNVGTWLWPLGGAISKSISRRLTWQCCLDPHREPNWSCSLTLKSYFEPGEEQIRCSAVLSLKWGSTCEASKRERAAESWPWIQSLHNISALRLFSRCFARTLCPTDRYALHGQWRPQDEHVLHSGECALPCCAGPTSLPVITLHTSCSSGASAGAGAHLVGRCCWFCFVTCYRTNPDTTRRWSAIRWRERGQSHRLWPLALLVM